MDINYSFIIPHHNCNELLSRCLGSIPSREDIQIIVVDDNSDVKPVISRPDVDVIFIDKEHTKGAGKARNEGLKIARGEWVVFADSDDFFCEGVMPMLDAHKDDSAEIVYFKAKGVDSGTLEPNGRAQKYNQYLTSYTKHAYDAENIVKTFHVVPWAKMIRRSLIAENGIAFDEVRWSNDVMFSVKTALAAKRISVDERTLYVVTSREASLIKQASMESALGRLDVAVRRNQFLVRKGLYFCLANLYTRKKKLARAYGKMGETGFYDTLRKNSFPRYYIWISLFFAHLRDFIIK